MNHCLFRILLLVALSCASTVYAVTLGEPRVKSFLGQPLELEIDLVGLEPDQQHDLELRIANAQYFERFGISYTESLDGLKFDVVRVGSRWMVRIRSELPMVETYVDFPLQVSWPGGELVQQYTLLLEPPVRTQRTLAAPEGRAAPEALHTPAAEYGNTYGPVRYGEILTAIAQKLKPDGTTTWQMSIVLYRANPYAFDGGNINKLRVGSILSVPPLDVIEKLDNPSAIAEFAAETTRWLAPMTGSSRGAEASESKKVDASPKTVSTTRKQRRELQSADSTPAEESIDEAQRIVVEDKSTTDAKHDDQRGLYEQLLVTMQDVETHRTTNDAVKTRLELLEARLAGMQELVALKNSKLVAIQAEAAARRAIQVAPETVETLPTSNTQPAGRHWYEGYLWIAWVAFGLIAFSTLFVMRRRSPIRAEQKNVFGPTQADRVGVTVGPEIEQKPPAAPVVGAGQPDAPEYGAEQPDAPEHEVEKPDAPEDEAEQPDTAEHGLEQTDTAEYEPEQPDAPEYELEQTDTAEYEPEQPDAPEHEPEQPDTAAYEVAEEVISEVNNLIPWDDMPDYEDFSNCELEQEDELSLDISEVQLASWAAELDENVGQDEEQAAHADTIERPVDEPDLLNDEPLQLEDDIPEFPIELEDPLPAETIEDLLIPGPDEFESTNHTDRNAGLSDHLDLVGCFGDDQDFSLSLDLARAYLEVGDEEGAEEILKQVLAGAPDPETRRQTEELLTRIESPGRTKASHIP